MSLLTLSDVSVQFGGLRALSGLTLAIAPGALHGLVGPNGAGKTTVMNVISGLVRPSAGSIAFAGRVFRPRPHHLAAQGLARTFQASACIDGLDAIGNVLLGALAGTRAGVIGCALRLPRAAQEERAARQRAEAALARVGYTASPRARIAELSTWQRRQVEIARALVGQPRLLLLDEPAAGLAAGEVEALRSLLRGLRDAAAGALSILLIEHNVPLVFTLCDTVTAMALGRDIAHGPPGEVRRHPEVVASYLGGSRPAAVAAVVARAPPAEAPVLLRLDAVSAGYGGTTVLRDVSLTVRQGETVALFGPNGAGKTTLLNTIVGERRALAGTLTLAGTPIGGLAVQSVVRAGIGIVPQGRAVMARQSVEDNLLISTTGLRTTARQRRARVEEMLERFPGLGRRRRSLGANLSGGERQMLAIAKALIRRPVLLLLDEPSIGLAPAVVEEVQRIVSELNAGGLTVMIGEQSVGWVIPVATRAYAIAAGRIVREGPPALLADAEALADQYLGA